jgi:hypothetical protein
MSHRESETSLTADRLGADLEVRQIVGQIHLNRRGTVRPHGNRRIEIGNRLEISAYRHPVEKARRFFFSLTPAGIFGKRQMSESKITGVTQGEP